MIKFKLIFSILLFALLPTIAHSQIANAEPNVLEPWVNSKFNNLVASDKSSGICLGNISGEDNLVNSDLADFANMNLLAGVFCTQQVRVKDTDSADTYPAGTYAGFVFDPSNLVSLSVFPTIKVEAYNNGSLKGEIVSITSLLGLQTFLNADGNAQLGAKSKFDFDELRFSVGSAISVIGGIKVYYPVIKRYELGPSLNCNMLTRFTNPQYPLEIEPTLTGVTGLSLGSISNAQNVISPSSTDFATIALTAGIFGTASLGIKDQLSNYPGGSYVGFEFNSSGISVELLSGYSLVTSLNGVEKDRYTPTELLDILDIPGRKFIGFTTTKSTGSVNKDFNEVRLELKQFAGLNIGTTKIYNAVIKRPCNIDAVADSFTATGTQAVNGAATVGNVLANDTYNDGAAGSATTTNVAISVTTAATPATSGAPVPTLDTATGVVSIPAGTPAGTYSITYKLCDKVAGTPCDSATISVVVAAPAIVAVADTLTSTADGGTTTSVLANDTYNGGAAGSATAANVTVTQDGTWPTGVTLNADGTITIAAGTPSGSYAVSYKICDKLNATNCSTVSTTVNVTPTVNAVTDSFTATGTQAVNGATTVDNVLSNDTYNSGAAGSATATNVAISVTTAATPATIGAPVPTLDTATGVVSIPTGTPAGTYSITYELCDKVAGTPCDSATISVVVAAPAIVAVADTLTSTADGGTTTSVLANDTYNGGAAGSATAANVTVAQDGTWPTGFTLNTDGTITVAAGTPPAEYSVSYQICDKLNPTSCSTATTIVKVTPTVNAVTDSFSATGNEALEGVGNLGNVLANDNINSGAPGSATIANVDITVTTAALPILPGGLVPVLDPSTGVVSVPVGTPAGLYSITYKICDQATGTLCSSATVDVQISAATFCYKLPVLDGDAGSTLDSRVGISALARTGIASTWPGIRKSGWIVLEAKTKGFVINRVTTTALASITPVEGMMVFDTTANCLKVYTYKGAVLGWYCMETQACPE